jgi:GH15 family glucan-1,4-alpha-glucosidase
MPGSLFERSIEIILENQAPGGAYPASPDFATYRYCWLRDGSFTAYAMDLVGEQSSAHRFHDWASRVVQARREVVRRAIEKSERSESLSHGDYLHTRFTLSGEDSTGADWPNFQLDGYGTWLWALTEHCRLAGIDIPPGWASAARLVADYLSALWWYPCYDLWEELPQQVHTHTLAAILGGLRAHAALTGADHNGPIRAIEQVLLVQGSPDGRFAKVLGGTEVDASLVGLAVPYRVVEPGDRRMKATVAEIERHLRRGGGLHRYPGDTYYGGGQWVLLTAWLGWYYQEAGDPARAAEALRWVEDQADRRGELPEQVPATLLHPKHYDAWVRRWGTIARPLLWSHAQYLILRHRHG